MSHRTRTALPAGVAAVALAVSACSSQGGKQEEKDDLETPPMTVAMVTHGAKGDTYWDLVRKGAEDAAAKSDITLEYNSDPEAGQQANLVENAVDSDVDGIAVTLAKPDAMRGAIDRAKEAGIPVVGLNAGIDDWRDAGLKEYFGADEKLAGKAFGEELNRAGAKTALCVIHEQGHVELERRCSALAKEFDGTSETLYVDGANMPEVKSSITSKLQEEKGIDYVATLGAPFAMTATESVDEAGSDAAVATFDTNKELVGAIKDGDVEWAIDQQPYLQGYLSVDGLWLYNTNRNVSGGGERPVLTGPDLVNKENVDEIEKYAKRGTR